MCSDMCVLLNMSYPRFILRCLPSFPCRVSTALPLWNRAVVPSCTVNRNRGTSRHGWWETSPLYSTFSFYRRSCTVSEQSSLSNSIEQSLSSTHSFKELSLEQLLQHLSCQELYSDERDVSIPPVTRQLLGRKAGSKWTSMGSLSDDIHRWFESHPRTSESYATLLKLLGLLGQTELIEMYLEEMRSQNIAITESVIAAAASSFALCHQFDEVKKLLLVVKKEGIVPSQSLLSITVLSLLRAGYFEDAIRVLITGKFEDMEWNNLPLSNSNDNTFCMESEETFSEALERIPDGYDIVTWTCLLKGLFDKGRYSFCLVAFEHLLSRKIELDSVVMDVVIQSCDKLRLVSRALEIHQLLKTTYPSTLNSAIYASLISCAASCADYRAAERFYEDAVCKRIPLTYRAYYHLLRVYGRTGEYQKAICVYHSLRFLPRSSLPSVHDWFLVFLSLRVAVQKVRNRYVSHPCESCACALENIRIQVNDIADALLEQGRLLSGQAKHLYGVMERYFNIKMQVEKWDDALQVLKSISVDPNLPVHWQSTRFRLFVSWSRYLSAVSVSERQIWCTLETMEACRVELNEPCVMAAIQGFIKMRQAQAALDLLQRPFVIMEQVERRHHLEQSDPVNWIQSQRRFTLRKLYCFLQQHEPSLLHRFQNILQEKGWTMEAEDWKRSNRDSVPWRDWRRW